MLKKQKVRQPELPHRKTQTPIVAKQIQFCMSDKHNIENREFCIFTYAKYVTMLRWKKGIISPKGQKTPIQKNIEFVWQIYFIIN